MPIITLPVIADAFVDSALPTTNFGSNVSVGSTPTIHSYLRFGLVDKLPGGIFIKDAKMTYVWDIGVSGVSGRWQVAADQALWDEAAITFNTRPSAVGTAILSQTLIGSVPQTITIGVTGLAREIVANAYKSEFRFIHLTGVQIGIKSKESPPGTDGAFLTVTYSGAPEIGNIQDRSRIPDMNRRTF